MGTYIPWTAEEKEQAASVDLEEFLRQRGEKLLLSGREKRLASDRSITIRGSEWYDHEEHEGGNAISFVRKHYGLSYPEAVEELLGRRRGQTYPIAQRTKTLPKPFELPEANGDMHRVFAYLVKGRHIDRSVVTHFAQARLLYEDARYHNCVFVGRESGESRPTPTSEAAIALARSFDRMWRAAIPGTASTTWGRMDGSLCLRPPLICSPTSPCTQKIGRPTAMWPAVGPLPSRRCPCWSGCPHRRRYTSA